MSEVIERYRGATLPTGRRGARRRGRRPTGFSLVELLTVVLVLAVSLTLGVPLFQTTIKNNRLQTEAYALRATLTNARSEALARRMPVTVCETTDGTACATDTTSWTSGYLAVADANNDRVVDAGEDVFLTRELSVPDAVAVRFRNAAGADASNIRFTPRGDSLDFSGTFVICDDRGAVAARAVVLSNSGQVRIASDADDNDIVEGLGGADVTCP